MRGIRRTRAVAAAALLSSAQGACAEGAEGPFPEPNPGGTNTCVQPTDFRVRSIDVGWTEARTFHRLHDDPVIRTNLQLDDNGEARWTHESYDLLGVPGLARWSRVDEEIHLSPPEGYGEFHWLGSNTWHERVREVRLRWDDQVDLVVVRVFDEEREPTVEHWDFGHLCADGCGGTSYLCDCPLEVPTCLTPDDFETFDECICPMASQWGEAAAIEGLQ